MSTSDTEFKLWNPSTGNCLHTIDIPNLVSGFILPNNKYALVGSKGGNMEIIDTGNATVTEVVEAYGGSVQSIVRLPNENGFVTGSLDGYVKFWEYEVKQKSPQDSKHLMVTNVRTMKMDTEVRVVAVSPDARCILVALDSRVKVYYMDKLNPFLTLFGHKLPVLCMDVSSDGDLIVTGSQDKNLKICQSLAANGSKPRGPIKSCPFSLNHGEERAARRKEMLKGDPPLNYEPHEIAKFVTEGHTPELKKGGDHVQ